MLCVLLKVWIEEIIEGGGVYLRFIVVKQLIGNPNSTYGMIFKLYLKASSFVDRKLCWVDFINSKILSFFSLRLHFERSFKSIIFV